MASSESNELPGMTVRQLIPGSPAVKAGIKPGDRLIAIDGHAINNAQDYMDATAEKVASRQVDVIRGNQLLTLTLTYEDKPAPDYHEVIGLLESDKNNSNRS